MTRIDLVKTATGLVVGSGISHIVAGVIKNTVVPKNIIDAGCIFAGRIGISMVLTDVTTKHINNKIDDAVTWLQQNVSDQNVG